MRGPNFLLKLASFELCSLTETYHGCKKSGNRVCLAENTFHFDNWKQFLWELRHCSFIKICYGLID